MKLAPIIALVCAVSGAGAQAPAGSSAQPLRVPTLQRLERGYLQRVRDDVAGLVKLRVSIAEAGPLHDWHCVLHCHCYQSHDSRGLIADIAAAAKSDGIDCIFMSDHPRDTYDVVAKGPHDVVDGVLFVPGSEADGFLVYPGDYRLPKLAVGEQPLIDEVKQSAGMIFIAHPEEHTDWKLHDLTGMEIYNTHADFKDETALMAALQPKNSAGFGQLLKLLNSMKEFPREAFAAIFDPQPDNLAHYDLMSKTHTLAAIAGNDSHQNVGFVVKGTADGKYQLEDALGEKIALLDPEKTPILKLVFGEPVAGHELFRRQLDAYAVSLGYVSTHILAPQRTEASLRKSLAEGRTYVAFDWIADPRGTSFTLSGADLPSPLTLGDTETYKPGLALKYRTPLPAHTRLMCDGKEVATTTTDSLEYTVTGPGIYRVESSLVVAGETRAWIYTGAIRIVP